jgi:parvulin-like peptidyl-prolyl isomerase
VQKQAKRLQIVLFSLILLLFLTSISCDKGKAGSDSGSGGEVAARVGSTEIPLSKVDQLIEQQLKQSQSGRKITDLNMSELATARLQVLDSLITDEILYQRARQDNIQITDEEVRAFIQKDIQQRGLSADDFQKELKNMGMTEEQLNEEAKHKMAVAKLQDKIGQVKPPTDKEIEDYYSRNPGQFTLGRGLALGQITVDAADNKAKNDAIGEDQAKQKIDTIYSQLKNGGDFATIARTQSEDPSALKSGDLGFLDEQALQQGGFPPQLIEAFYKMREGDITPPVQGSKGRWYIFKVTAKRTQEEKLTLDSPQVKSQISQLLVEQRKNILNNALLVTATNQIRVENLLAQRILQNPDNFGSLRPTSLAAGDGATKAEEKKDAPKETPKAESTPAKDEKDSKKTEKPAEQDKEKKSTEAGK